MVCIAARLSAIRVASPHHGAQANRLSATLAKRTQASATRRGGTQPGHTAGAHSRKEVQAPRRITHAGYAGAVPVHVAPVPCDLGSPVHVAIGVSGRGLVAPACTLWLAVSGCRGPGPFALRYQY